MTVVRHVVIERSADEKALVEDFRNRIIRAMGALRVITDDYTDLVELDAVLDAIRAVKGLPDIEPWKALGLGNLQE